MSDAFEQAFRNAQKGNRIVPVDRDSFSRGWAAAISAAAQLVEQWKWYEHKGDSPGDMRKVTAAVRELECEVKT